MARMSTRRPPDHVTEEATKEGLRLAHEAGTAYQRMVDYFIANVAQWGASQRAGEYKIGLAVEEAEPLYHLVGDQLHLAHPPVGANAHIEVVVTDADDGRFIPDLTVQVTLVRGSDGEEIGTFHLPFLWHPTMYHYGVSVQVPEEGRHRARVGIGIPAFPRHDKTNGKRYEQAVVAEFDGVEITTGRK